MFYKFICFITLFAFTICVSPQDQISHQSRIDKISYAKDVPKISVLQIKKIANLNVSEFYTSWEHDKISNVSGNISKSTDISLANFCMPTSSRTVTSIYGMRWGRMHQGLDIKVYIGDSIYSAFSGKVRIAGYDFRGYGYYVVVRHHNGLETLYGHLSRIIVEQDQEIKSGQCIGLGGNTGRSTGSHLHFEVRLIGTPINPAEIFNFELQDLTADVYKVKKDYSR